MDHDLTTAPGAVDADGPASGGPDTEGARTASQAGPPRQRGARGGLPGQAGGGADGGAGGDFGEGAGDGVGSGVGSGEADEQTAGTAGVAAPSGVGGDAEGAESADAASSASSASTATAAATASATGTSGAAGATGPSGTVRLASPGSVVASIPFLFGFHPENSLVVLGVSHSAAGGSFIRHGVRIDLEQVRGHERTTALELAARLRDQDADIAILVAFGPRGATGAKARPDHCRKLMAAFRAQLEAAASEERVTVVDALYTANGRWWSYMCRNNRCCPAAGTVVPAEAPAALAGAFAARGHTVYASREALEATLDPHPREVLARTAAAVEKLDPGWYDTDAGLADARRLMDVLLARCAEDPAGAAPRSSRGEGPRSGRRGLSDSATAALAAADDVSSAAESARQKDRSTAPASEGLQDADASSQTSNAAIPAARSSRRVTNRVPALVATPDGIPLGALAEPPSSLLAPPAITDGEAAELLVALLNWRVRDYLACAAATVDSAGRLLRLGAELARRAPHPDLRLAPYALAAWAAWAIGRPAIAQCAVDRALAIDPEYKFASLIRAGLHHAIDGEGVRESAASTRRDLFGEDAAGADAATPCDSAADPTDPDTDPAPIPAPRSTQNVPHEPDVEIP